MPIKFYRPTTHTLRWRATSDFSELTDRTQSKPLRSLTEAVRKSGGRNHSGHRTSRGRSGGHRRRYRLIDFHRNKIGVQGVILSIEYDPNRSARIALVEYPDGEKRYILAPQGLKAGDKVASGSGSEIAPGNALALKEIPAGTFVHNIELRRGQGGKLVRSAGGYAILMSKDKGYAQLKMPSSEIRLIPDDCVATIGQIGNIDHENQSWGKAGRSRWLGWRPTSRAVAKNPVDHPMGGGEGKSSGGRHPCNRRGQYAKGLKTRSRSKLSNKYILERRK